MYVSRSTVVKVNPLNQGADFARWNVVQTTRGVKLIPALRYPIDEVQSNLLGGSKNYPFINLVQWFLHRNLSWLLSSESSVTHRNLLIEKMKKGHPQRKFWYIGVKFINFGWVLIWRLNGETAMASSVRAGRAPSLVNRKSDNKYNNWRIKLRKPLHFDVINRKDKNYSSFFLKNILVCKTWQATNLHVFAHCANPWTSNTFISSIK